MAASTKVPSPKSGVGILDEIEQLRQTLQDYQEDIDEKRAALNEAELGWNNTLEQMQEKLDKLKMGNVDASPSGSNATPSTASGPAPKYGTAPTPKAAPTPKNNLPTPKGNTTPTPKKGGKGGKAKGKDGMTCAEAVWNVLDRDPATFKELLEEYPDDAIGLKPIEVKEIILKEKKWESSSDPAQQIHAVMGQLRHEGKLGRDDASRYYPIKNAELYGPPLNSDGSPMTLQDDGTFKMKDGRVFYWQDGKTPVPQRKRRGKRTDEAKAE